MENNISRKQIEQLSLDFEVLELRVSIPSNPYKYAPLGGHIMERIYFLKNHLPNSELLPEFENLYTYWKKINDTLTGWHNTGNIPKDKYLNL